MSVEQDDWYKATAAAWQGAMQRVARSCEADPDRRRDVLQDMHVALWKSFSSFDGKCSVKTWVYRIATNVAANHVNREKRTNKPLLSLDAAGELPLAADTEEQHASNDALTKLYCLIETLNPTDRTILTLYLEGLDAAAIGDVTGFSPRAIATRISRAKALLSRMFQEKAHD